MSYLEYINKLSELKQTIVPSMDTLSELMILFGIIVKFVLFTGAIILLAGIIALVVGWFFEELMEWISRRIKMSIMIDYDEVFPFVMVGCILVSLAILSGIGFIGAPSTETTEKPMSHSDSLVQLHNNLVNWSDSDFDELWNATVKYKLTRDDDKEYGEVVKVIKQVKASKDKIKE